VLANNFYSTLCRIGLHQSFYLHEKAPDKSRLYGGFKLLDLRDCFLAKDADRTGLARCPEEASRIVASAMGYGSRGQAHCLRGKARTMWSA
jgi:hypothetical protein